MAVTGEQGQEQEQVARRGDWVQVHQVVLPPGQRAPQVPPETQAVPLELWVKGFLQDDGVRLGQEAEIETVSGRRLRGRLVAVNPRYEDDFGAPVPELLTVGSELRRLLGQGSCARSAGRGAAR